jgi:hypothetical protein
MGFFVQYSRTPENTTFEKLDIIPSAGAGEGDTYSIGSLRKS